MGIRENNDNDNDYPYGFLQESHHEIDQSPRLLDALKLKENLESPINTFNDSDTIAIRNLLFQSSLWDESLKDVKVDGTTQTNNDSDKFESDFEKKSKEINNLLKNFVTAKQSNFSISLEKRLRPRLFVNDDIINLVHVNETAKNNKLEYAGRQKKKARTLDTYAESLLHANRIFNKAYGLERRKVPAHMPHLLDRTVVREMQDKFAGEFDKTSRHRVRDPEDMQFAFSYYYFLLSEIREVSPEEIFDTYDTDKSQ